jgi:hypothetical protein
MCIDEGNGRTEFGDGYVSLWDEKWDGEEERGRSGDVGRRVGDAVAGGCDEGAEEK